MARDHSPIVKQSRLVFQVNMAIKELEAVAYT